MRDDYEAFEALRAKIVVVTPHDAEKTRTYWRKHQLPFIGVADPEGNITRRLGQQWKLLALGRMPAQLVVDCHGKLKLGHYGKSMADILPNERILEVLRGITPCSGS